jgi:L-ascorbate metabolism protein UlaG (beta-lactamase superfamily)
MRVTWVGHSTVVLELDGVRLVTDPVLRARFSILRRVAGPAVELDAVDAVLISHLHADHLDPPSLRQVQTAPVFVPEGGARFLRRRGFADVRELPVGETARVGGLELTATFAEHPGKRMPWSPAAPAVGYLIAGSQRVYFAGDTDLFPGMSAFAPVDLALLPIAGWGPRLPAGHMNARSAVQALGLLRARAAVPIHWGTYRRLGMRASVALLRAPADEFARLAAADQPTVEVHVLPVGGTLELAQVHA